MGAVGALSEAQELPRLGFNVKCGSSWARPKWEQQGRLNLMVGTLPWKGRGWQGADIAVLSSGKRGREDSGGLWREAEKQTNPGWVARSATVQGPELGEHEGAAGKREKKKS